MTNWGGGGGELKNTMCGGSGGNARGGGDIKLIRLVYIFEQVWTTFEKNIFQDFSRQNRPVNFELTWAVCMFFKWKMSFLLFVWRSNCFRAYRANKSKKYTLEKYA